MGIRVRDLNYEIASNRILRNLNANIEEGYFTGIIGPNGSGKTSFIRHLYGAIKLPDGSIYIDDQDIQTLSSKEIAKKLAVLMQERESIFDYRVIDLVLLGRSPHKKLMEGENSKDYEIAIDSLNSVGMKDYWDRGFSSLSGGEKQKVLLARALAQEPKYLILDEPTNHLDIKNQLQIMNLIKKLNITVIAAIHDLNIASIFCDYIYILKNGSFIKEGKTSEVLNSEIIKEVYGVDSKQIYDKEYETYNIIYNPSV